MAERTEAGAGEPVIFVFETSSHAFWAEDIAHENDVPVDVVSAPSRAEAKCGLALRVPDGQAGGLEDAFRKQGIRFERFDGG